MCFARHALASLVAAAVGFGVFAGAAFATSPVEGTPQAAPRLGSVPVETYRLSGGSELHVASAVYDRTEVAPLVAELGDLPHGAELASLQVYVADREEVASLCGERAMACYDPGAERMTIDGQDEEIAGISRASVIAHEYGHHVANNSAPGIWSAFDAGTLRWSTYENVCERVREGLAFPGNQAGGYWENPGEAFAQSFSDMVMPSEEWNYSPLFRPDPTALAKLRRDVLEPVAPREVTWSSGLQLGDSEAGLAGATPADGGAIVRSLAEPYDGRVRVRLHPAGGRYRLLLRDAATGETLASAGPRGDGSTRLRYADCGHRQLELEAVPQGAADGFSASVRLP